MGFPMPLGVGILRQFLRVHQNLSLTCRRAYALLRSPLCPRMLIIAVAGRETLAISCFHLCRFATAFHLKHFKKEFFVRSIRSKNILTESGAGCLQALNRDFIQD